MVFNFLFLFKVEMLRSQRSDRLVPFRVQRFSRNERAGNRNPEEIRIVRTEPRNAIQHSGFLLQTVEQFGMFFVGQKCRGGRFAVRSHQPRRNLFKRLNHKNYFFILIILCLYDGL